MPYIRKSTRASLDERESVPETAGELNYMFTKLVVDYITRMGLSYQRMNDVVGALEGAKAEFQRRVVALYEEGKIRENGDVYPTKLTGV